MNTEAWKEDASTEDTDPLLAEILQQMHAGLNNILGSRLEAVYLYGSRARRQAQPDSDIDLLVVVNGVPDYTDLFDLTLDLTADLSLQYDVVISRAFVSKESFTSEMNPFLMNVRREAVQV